MRSCNRALSFSEPSFQSETTRYAGRDAFPETTDRDLRCAPAPYVWVALHKHPTADGTDDWKCYRVAQIRTAAADLSTLQCRGLDQHDLLGVHRPPDAIKIPAIPA